VKALNFGPLENFGHFLSRSVSPLGVKCSTKKKKQTGPSLQILQVSLYSFFSWTHFGDNKPF
jgi:hypothetical protein